MSELCPGCVRLRAALERIVEEGVALASPLNDSPRRLVWIAREALLGLLELDQPPIGCDKPRFLEPSS